jgi:hypothetical protein
MKTIVSRLSGLHPEEQAFALGATACVSKDGSLHGVARGYPSRRIAGAMLLRMRFKRDRHADGAVGAPLQARRTYH